MITKEQIRDYLKRSGDDKVPDGILVEEPEKGFMVVQIHYDCIVCMCAYGDGKYWLDRLVLLAKTLNKPKVKMATRRNPRAFERKFGFKTIGYLLEKEV